MSDLEPVDMEMEEFMEDFTSNTHGMSENERAEFVWDLCQEFYSKGFENAHG